MKWIQKVQNKTQAEKVRLIWMFVIIAGLLLVILWIVTWGYKKTAPKDTKVFDTLIEGVNKAGDKLKNK